MSTLYGTLKNITQPGVSPHSDILKKTQLQNIEKSIEIMNIQGFQHTGMDIIHYVLSCEKEELKDILQKRNLLHTLLMNYKVYLAMHTPKDSIQLKLDL